jgi:MATE family multidrug resistance protein
MDLPPSTPLIPVSSSNVANQKASARQEITWLLKNAIPLVISYLLQNSLQSVSVISAGHLVSQWFLLKNYRSLGSFSL